MCYDPELLKTAASILRVPVEVVETHAKELPEYDAVYFWNPARGGFAVIIASNGEKLSATSAVTFERHLAAFAGGKRN